MMAYYVYLILSKTMNKNISYVGYTNNIEKRITLHNNSKGAKFTKGKRWKLIYLEKYYNKSNAMKEEYKLKKNYKLRKQIITKYLKNENFNSPTL